MASSDDFVHYCYLLSTWIGITLALHFFIKTCTICLTKTRHPPEPPALPIIGHLHLLSSRLPKSLETLASRYGPLMQIRMGTTPIIVVSDADTARQILKTHDVEFASKFALGFGLAKFDIYDGDSFISCDYGTYWRFMKKLCMTQLFAGAQLDQFRHIREQETLTFLKSLLEKSRHGEACDLGKELPTLANNIICLMAIGKRCAENPDLPVEIRNLVKKMMECAAGLGFTNVFGPLKRFDLSGYGKRLVSATWEYDRLMEKIMKVYQDDNEMKSLDGGGKDVMDLLLETYQDPDADLKLTRNQIKRFFLDIFFAAVDTTAATIQFALVQLMNNPKILKKLRKEIDSVVGRNTLVKESDVPKLPYLQAIVKETLRIHPAGPLLRRKCNIDTNINGYNIRAGTRIIINSYAIMRDPDTWHEPDSFIPERFLVNSGDNNNANAQNYQMDFKGQDCCFMPFGSGRRGCLAANHALNVTFGALAALVQCFDWEVKDADKIDINMVTGYSGAMALPLLCHPVTRFDPFQEAHV